MPYCHEHALKGRAGPGTVGVTAVGNLQKCEVLGCPNYVWADDDGQDAESDGLREPEDDAPLPPVEADDRDH